MRKYQKLDIEGAILDEEQLKKHMEKIAIQHTLKSKSDKNTYPIPQMLTNYGLIKSTYNLLNEHIKLGINIHPAGEWLLDNFYIISESGKNIIKKSVNGKNKVYEGIIEEAGKDHLIIRDNTNNLWYLIRILYLNYVEFMEPIIYSHAYSEKTY